MKMFVPWSDDWDSGLPFKGAVLVPYRCGLPVWRDPPVVDLKPAEGSTTKDKVSETMPVLEPIATAA